MKALIWICLVFLPLKNLRINSGFGYRIHPLSGKCTMHEGIDLKARHDTVYAVLDGSVRSIGYDDGLGVNIRLQHGNIETIYGHLSQVFIFSGESVAAGTPIGITGATGRVTGEHLHFAARYKNEFINPIKFLYKLLITNEHEQKFQSTAGSAFRKADRRN